MAIYRCTMIFAAANYGWTESYYLDVGTIDIADETFFTLATSRANLLGVAANIIATKINSVTVPGVSLVKPRNIVAQPMIEKNMRDQPYNGLYVRVSDFTRAYRRQLFLRGVKDDWIRIDPMTGLPTDPGIINNLVMQYQMSLTTAGVKMRVILKNPDPTIRKSITNVVAAGTKPVIYTVTAPAHGFVTGNTVRIGKTRGVGLETFVGGKRFRLAGPNVVTVVDANSFTVALPGEVAFPLEVTQFGYAVKQTVDYVSIRFAEFQRYAERKTGGPFFRQRGRSRARR